MKQAIDDYLAAVRAIYDEHGADSPFSFELRPGAGTRTLGRAEKALGVPVDSTLEVLWRTADGSERSPLFHDARRLCSYALLSVDDALAARKYFEVRAPQYDGTFESSDPRDPRVGEGWFSAGWMPFAAIEGGSVQLLVDHQPLGTGSAGQVIGYVHDPDQIVFIAESLLDLLPASLAAIEKDPDEFLCIF